MKQQLFAPIRSMCNAMTVCLTPFRFLQLSKQIQEEAEARDEMERYGDVVFQVNFCFKTLRTNAIFYFLCGAII